METSSHLYQLVYVSSTTGLLSKEELIELLKHSRDSNKRRGITGMLLYRDGNVMQALEGEESTVRQLWGRISLDPRHSGIIVLTQGPIHQREFPDWEMGFRDLRSPELRELPGYSEMMNTSLDASVDGARAWRLLRLFKSQR